MRRLLLAALTTFMCVVGAPSEALVPVIAITDFAYNPTYFKGRFDVDIGIRNDGDVQHTFTTKESVPGSFSATLDPDDSVITDFFDNVGTAPYYCQFHPRRMQGKVGAMPTADNTTKPLGEVFALEWARVAGGVTTSFDIQVKKPGSDRFVSLFRNTTDAGDNFEPNRKGVYRIRGRTQRSSGQSTGWSPSIKLTVTEPV